MTQAQTAFEAAASRAQNTAGYSMERALAQYHLSLIKMRAALQTGGSAGSGRYQQLVEAAAVRGEEAARLNPAVNIRQQACRAHLLNRASQISRAQADIRCTPGTSVEGALLNALSKLRKGQFHTPLSDTIGAFQPAEDAFRQATANHRGSLSQTLPPHWGIGASTPTYGEVFEHGALIANLCSRRGGEQARPPAGDLSRREAVFRSYGLFGCRP